MPTSHEKRKRGAPLWHISWRVRLMLAFAVLILTSATATIFIGNMVLGSSISELAKSKANQDLRNIWQYWDWKITVMRCRLNTVSMFLDSEPDSIDKSLNALKAEEGVFDFVGLVDEKGNLIMHHPPLTGRWTIPPSFQAFADAMEGVGTIAFPILVPFADATQEIPDLEDRLASYTKTDKVMVLLAGSKITEGEKGQIGFLYGGFVVNGADDLVRSMVVNVDLNSTSSWNMGTTTSVFQHDIRIATYTDGQKRTEEHNIPILSGADHRVSNQVLKKGEPFVGVADVVGKKYYTAYKPIRDFTEKIIGMVGIGSLVHEYKEAQAETITLFSAIIAAGMLLGFAMTYTFSGWLVRPIAALAEGVSRMAEGDLNYKIPISSDDELGKLTRAFNRMVQTVKERDLKMHEMTENRLSEVEKQISIGRLAAGVAHEINNPMTAILSLSSLMLRHTSKDDPRREDLEIVVSETRRCREIVSGLLDFARERPPMKKIIDVRQVLKDTLALANKYDSLKGADIRMEFFDQPLMVMGDPQQLQQVFTNLILNAVEAVEEAVRDDPHPKGYVEIVADEDSSGEIIQIQVIDSGIGIPKDQINKIFEPFYTTKGKSKGTGLGLSVSLGIIQKHNGVVQIDSYEGRGTTVTVTLPLYHGE